MNLECSSELGEQEEVKSYCYSFAFYGKAGVKVSQKRQPVTSVHETV